MVCFHYVNYPFLCFIRFHISLAFGPNEAILRWFENQSVNLSIDDWRSRPIFICFRCMCQANILYICSNIKSKPLCTTRLPF